MDIRSAVWNVDLTVIVPWEKNNESGRNVSMYVFPLKSFTFELSLLFKFQSDKLLKKTVL